MREYAIGVDLGGTNLRAAAISTEGKMLRKVSGATPVSAGREAVTADIVQSIQALRQDLGEHSLAGVGVGIPGYILMEKGIVTGAPNLPSFVNYPIRDEIEAKLGARVILENDANAAAIGEKWMGAGRGTDDLVMLTLGTVQRAPTEVRTGLSSRPGCFGRETLSTAPDHCPEKGS